MTSRTQAGEIATDVVLSVFRANGLLLASGDALSASEGLTAARWQVLGAIALAERPLTVPQIARRMGISRQSVHTTINRLSDEGLVELAPNMDHSRSALVRLTELGAHRYHALDERQARWVNRLVEGIPRADLDATARVLADLSERLAEETAPRRSAA